MSESLPGFGVEVGARDDSQGQVLLSHLEVHIHGHRILLQIRGAPLVKLPHKNHRVIIVYKGFRVGRFCLKKI